MSFNIDAIRANFPILSQQVNGKPLVYFDNGATSQKPQVVIDAISKYYQEINANIHRGVHTLSQLATDAYEASRGKIQIVGFSRLLVEIKSTSFVNETTRISSSRNRENFVSF
jgi:cysteine desulfurase/selenocysteine lyase